MNEEIWKDIPGYEGYYQVSNLGGLKVYQEGNNGLIGKHITISEKLKRQTEGIFP